MKDGGELNAEIDGLEFVPVLDDESDSVAFLVGKDAGLRSKADRGEADSGQGGGCQIGGELSPSM